MPDGRANGTPPATRVLRLAGPALQPAAVETGGGRNAEGNSPGKASNRLRPGSSRGIWRISLLKRMLEGRADPQRDEMAAGLP